jgi:hypothetical protein
MAAEADAVVCIVARRYGYVPPKELGGDGERSITWLEVDAASRAGKPVLAFILDANAPRTEFKPSERLNAESPQEVVETLQATQKLEEFKAYLEREFTRKTSRMPTNLPNWLSLLFPSLPEIPEKNAPPVPRFKANGSRQRSRC